MDAISKWNNVYTIYGKEIGAEGTKHLQGFTILNKNGRISAVKKLHATAHWEAAKGSWEQNVTYCSKDGDITEFGTRPITKKRQGEQEKERWDNAKKQAIEGNIEDIDADIYLRYYRTLKEIKKDHMVKPEDAIDTTGEWYYGGPGTGKSKTAREKFPGAYDKMQNKWWDGYQGEDNVILDDFDSKELGHHLKIWGDRYSFLAETKGGAMNIRPKKIIITSNYSIDELWEDEAMREALKRRFKITHFFSFLGGKPFL